MGSASAFREELTSSRTRPCLADSHVPACACVLETACRCLPAIGGLPDGESQSGSRPDPQRFPADAEGQPARASDVPVSASGFPSNGRRVRPSRRRVESGAGRHRISAAIRHAGPGLVPTSRSTARPIWSLCCPASHGRRTYRPRKGATPRWALPNARCMIPSGCSRPARRSCRVFV